MKQLSLNDIIDQKSNISKFRNPILKELNDDLKRLKNKVISFTTNSIVLPAGQQISNNKFLGTSPGFYIEEFVFQEIEKLKKYQITHNKQGTIFDYYLVNPANNHRYNIDCKAALKSSNAKITQNQLDGANEYVTYDQEDTASLFLNDNWHDGYIIYVKYRVEFSANSINYIIVDICLMPIVLAGTNKDRVSSINYDKISDVYCKNNKKSSIYENLIFSYTGKQEPRSLSETINYLDYNINESKKRVQLKKFIEENFNKKGEYITPKDGNSKCTLHPEYDKNLLRFFAEHGITKIMSAYGKNVPSLGYSTSEEKWYGWSHRAIYGFGVGDKIKKGTCGYEKMKEKGLLNIKTIDQAREVAKIFAEDVA